MSLEPAHTLVQKAFRGFSTRVGFINSSGNKPNRRSNSCSAFNPGLAVTLMPQAMICLNTAARISR